MRNIMIAVLFASLTIGGLASCGSSPAEEVPLNKQTRPSQQYRVPDPQRLSTEEQEEVNEIRNEYYENVPQ